MALPVQEPEAEQEAPGATAAGTDGSREPMVSDHERGLHSDTAGAVPRVAAGSIVQMLTWQSGKEWVRGHCTGYVASIPNADNLAT